MGLYTFDNYTDLTALLTQMKRDTPLLQVTNGKADYDEIGLGLFENRSTVNRREATIKLVIVTYTAPD